MDHLSLQVFWEFILENGTLKMIHEKILDITIEALRLGHTLDQITNFIYSLQGITIETTEIKVLEYGEKKK